MSVCLSTLAYIENHTSAELTAINFFLNNEYIYFLNLIVITLDSFFLTSIVYRIALCCIVYATTLL